MEQKLILPAGKETLSRLLAGDRLLLTGLIYTARDAAHKRLTELIARGAPLPFPLKDSAIYYAGPTPEPPGRVIGSAGPTTSGRMDSYAPALLDRGLSIMIGKGARSPQVVSSMVKNGAVYLAAMGGAGALTASRVRRARIICWEDLGCEAVRELYVEALPLIVAIDSLGGNIYEMGPAAYLESLKGGN